MHPTQSYNYYGHGQSFDMPDDSTNSYLDQINYTPVDSNQQLYSTHQNPSIHGSHFQNINNTGLDSDMRLLSLDQQPLPFTPGARQFHYNYDQRRTRPEDSSLHPQFEDPRLVQSSSNVHGTSMYHRHRNGYPRDALIPTGVVSSHDSIHASTLYANPPPQSQLQPQPPTPSMPVWSLANIRGQMVPQRPYDSRSRREGRSLEPPIIFRVGDRNGISVRAALDKRYSELRDRDEFMFVNRASSIFLRFEWPGYPSFANMIKTKDWRAPNKPITLAKLSTEISKSLQKFIQQIQEEGIESEEPPWRLGSQYLDVDSLVLLSLDHVSQGSWQPSFKVIDS